VIYQEEKQPKAINDPNQDVPKYIMLVLLVSDIKLRLGGKKKFRTFHEGMCGEAEV
jgi:hypothetical protein